MRGISAIFRREWSAFFNTPIAYCFLVFFLTVASALTFYVGDLLDLGEAKLDAYFQMVPWLLLLLVPAVAMRLWAEERRAGTFELLMTLPIKPWQAVLGKFLAAWAFLAIALLLSMSLWIAITWLGEPDHGVIAVSYLGAFLLAGALLAMAGFASSLTTNQVIAFILALALCFIFTMSGLRLILGPVEGLLGPIASETISQFSALTHFENMARGVIDPRDLLFFASLILFWLVATTFVVGGRR